MSPRFLRAWRCPLVGCTICAARRSASVRVAVRSCALVRKGSAHVASLREARLTSAFCCELLYERANIFLKIPAFWRGLDANRHAACPSGTAVHAIAGRPLAAPGVQPVHVSSCPQCAVGAAVQRSRARAPCSRRVEHELQNAQNGSGPPYRQCDGTARREAFRSIGAGRLDLT